MSPHPTRTLPFEPRFRRALRRLRRRSVLRASARLVPWLQIVLLTLLVADRLALAALPVWPAVTVLAAVLAAAVLWSAWGSPTGRDAALVLDRRLGTRELLTTARESTPDTHPFGALVHRRAAAALDGAAVARALPLTSWPSWRPALLGLAAVLLAGLLPPLREKASAVPTGPDPAVVAAAEALAQELAVLADQAAELERPEAADALKRLEQMVDDMRTGALPTVENALVALNKTEDALAALSEKAPDGGLDELIEDLAAEPLSADLAKAMGELDRAAIRRALERMADALSPSAARAAAVDREIARLAERFEELAESLERQGEKDLARLVSELAKALRQGDLGRAEEILRSDRLAMALEGAAALCQGEGLGDSIGELLQTARYLLGKKDPAALRTDEGFRPGPLDRNGPHPGTESTNRQGKGYETGSPILRDRQTAGTSDRQGEFEALYDSRLAAGEGFEDLLATGQIGSEGEMLSEEGRALGVDTEASLPLRPFGTAASGAPERAVDLESVPLGYRDLVRSYFERNDGKEGGDR